MAQAQLAQLKIIAINTGRNADTANQIMDLFNAVVLGTKKINVK